MRECVCLLRARACVRVGCGACVRACVRACVWGCVSGSGITEVTGCPSKPKNSFLMPGSEAPL